MCVKRRGYRDIKGSCLACTPVCQQKVSRAGATMVSREVIATKMGFSQNIAKGVLSCYNITPMLTSDGMMSKRPGKGHCQGKVHTGTPGMCPYQATTLWQLDGLVDQGANPTLVMAQQTARMIHVVRKLKSTVLCQQWRKLPTVD